LDTAAASVQMPASMAMALLEVIEDKPGLRAQQGDEARQFQRDRQMDLGRIIETSR
jgi:hypothetical protein